MPVISMVSPKGGVGKTTTTITLAGELALTGEKITIIDADPNGPIARWAKLPGKPDNISVVVDESQETIIDNIDQARKSAKLVLVDLEGTASTRVTFAVGRSDLVLIPCQPSKLDADEAAKAIKLIRQTGKHIGRTIPHAIVFTKMPAAIVTKTFRDLRGQFERHEINTLNVQMIEREAFRAMFSIGGTVYTLDKSDVGGLEAARENSQALASEVLDALRSAMKNAA